MSVLAAACVFSTHLSGWPISALASSLSGQCCWSPPAGTRPSTSASPREEADIALSLTPHPGNACSPFHTTAETSCHLSQDFSEDLEMPERLPKQLYIMSWRPDLGGTQPRTMTQIMPQDWFWKKPLPFLMEQIEAGPVDHRDARPSLDAAARNTLVTAPGSGLRPHHCGQQPRDGTHTVPTSLGMVCPLLPATSLPSWKLPFSADRFHLDGGQVSLSTPPPCLVSMSLNLCSGDLGGARTPVM